jgi:hypothetical protein
MDPVTAYAMKATLERLRTHRDPVLRDLAAALLSGRLNLSDITTTTEALPALQRALDDYAGWRTSLTDEEFASVTGEARERVEELRRRIAEDGDGHA